MIGYVTAGGSIACRFFNRPTVGGDGGVCREFGGVYGGMVAYGCSDAPSPLFRREKKNVVALIDGFNCCPYLFLSEPPV